MSLFNTIELSCPACQAKVNFEAVTSVNADRRPDLRKAILAGTFQRLPCPSCKVPFRLDPAFTYVDSKRGQWIQAQACGDVGNWEPLEKNARKSFSTSYGPGAPGLARRIGERMKPRLVFGWAALREKIAAAEAGLDDLALELTKIASLPGGTVHLDNRAELRFAEVKDGQLVFAWITADTGQVRETFTLPKAAYDKIAADIVGWAAVRKDFDGALFMDMQRLMLPLV